MSRDLKKYLEEYRAKYYHNQGKRGSCFYQTDAQQIFKMSEGDLCEAIFNALEAGFMVGYKAAKRERRKGTQQA